MKIKTRNAISDLVNGTNVQEVDARGDRVQGGLFHGNVFKSVKWTTRKQLDNSGCPTWIDTVVVSKSLTGARNGQGLITQDPGVDVSSSTNSKQVTALVVDEHGKEIGRKVFDYSLVRGIAGEPPAGQNAIATELWFSQAPIQEIIDNQPTTALKDELTEMRDFCFRGEPGVQPNEGPGN